MTPLLGITIYTASTWVLPLLLAITLHEAAHGYVSRIFGDDTASRLGRVSLNPLNHVDPIVTVLSWRYRLCSIRLFCLVTPSRCR